MKKQLGPANALYPSLTTIVGAMVDHKPNFLTVAHVGIMNHGQPQFLSVSLGKVHHTNHGIFEAKAFSICLPGQDLVTRTDYVGIVSGKKTDKSDVFSVFTGERTSAPMISECPVCIECSLYTTVDFPTHDVFVGQIEEVYADEEVVGENGKIDIARVRPLLFDMASVKYWSLGEPVADCWSEGKKLKG